MGTYTSMRASRQAWDVGIAVRFVALQLDQSPPPFAAHAQVLGNRRKRRRVITSSDEEGVPVGVRDAEQSQV